MKMLDHHSIPEPRRGLQIYDRESQKAFRHMSAKSKLEYLGGVLKLYWAAWNQRQMNPPEMVQDKKKDLER